MNVVHLIGGGDTGGAKTHVLNLLRELGGSIRAQLVCFREGDFAEDARKMGLPVHVIDSSNPLVGLKALKKLLAGQQVDIIHCHGARGNLMGTLLRRSVKAPVITTVHSDPKLDYVGRPMARLVYGGANAVCLRRVDAYIAVADPVAELLIDRGFPADRIYTMYNGIDFSPPQQVVPRQEFLRSLGLDVKEGDVVAGIAARLTPVKDYPTLLKAMKIACEQLPNLKLVAAGDGEDREKLEAMVKELGLEDRVCLAGWVKDTDSFFSAIDINLLTSVTEGFPYVLPEGARMHLATISSRVGGIPAIIQDGRTGFLFEPGDVEKLASLLVSVAGDAALREKMGEAIFRYAKEKFSMERMVAYQLEIYRDLLARRERRLRYPKRDGVVICGAYGFGNAGDDAILKSIIGSVKEMDETMPITVLAKNTESIRKRYRVNAVYTLAIPKVLWSLRRSRLYINGGGTLIQNATSQRSLLYYLFTLRAAKFLGNRVAMYGCGIGPVTGKASIAMASRVLDGAVDSITLREPDSVRELEQYGVRKPRIVLSSDPALALQSASSEEGELYLSNHGMDPAGRYLCFTLRTWYGFAEKAKDIAACADYAYERWGLTPVFLSLNVVHDSRAAAQVTEHMKSPYFVINDAAEPELLIAVLGKMQAVVSMRLHGLILAAMSGVPLVGVSYDPKVGAFLRYLDCGSGCMDLDDVSEEALRQAVDRAVGEIPQRQELLESARRLEDLERENAQAVRRLLED